MSEDYYKRNHAHQGLDVDGSPPVTLADLEYDALPQWLPAAIRYGKFSRAYNSSNTIVIEAGSEITLWDGTKYVMGRDTAGATVSDASTSTTKYLYAEYSAGGISWSLSETAPTWSATYGWWILGTDMTYRYTGCAFAKSSTTAFYTMQVYGVGSNLVCHDWRNTTIGAGGPTIYNATPAATNTPYNLTVTPYLVAIAGAGSSTNLRRVQFVTLIAGGVAAACIFYIITPQGATYNTACRLNEVRYAVNSQANSPVNWTDSPTPHATFSVVAGGAVAASTVLLSSAHFEF